MKVYLRDLFTHAEIIALGDGFAAVQMPEGNIWRLGADEDYDVHHFDGDKLVSVNEYGDVVVNDTKGEKCWLGFFMKRPITKEDLT